MIELNEIEINSVSGGLGSIQLYIYIANAALEFLSGWRDGVNDATS